VEIAAEDVVAIEPEEVFTPLPAKPIVKAPYRELVEAAAARYKVDADLITSVIAVESKLRSKSIVAQECARADATLAGDGGAAGSAKHLRPAGNIDAGTRYLRELLQMYNHDLALALAAYNAGPSACSNMAAFRLCGNAFVCTPRQAQL